MVVCSANTATATPIRIPAGMQRFTVFSVTKRAAAPAPPRYRRPPWRSAASAWRYRRCRAPAAPTAPAENAASRRPQNRLVPLKEKRVCPSRHNVTQAVKKLFVIARGRRRPRAPPPDAEYTGWRPPLPRKPRRRPPAPRPHASPPEYRRPPTRSEWRRWSRPPSGR